MRAPHPALRGLLGAYVGYRDSLHPDAVHHGLPSPATTVILAFEEPIDTSWLSGSDRVRSWRLVGGLHLQPALIRTHGFQHGIQLSLTPAGVRRLFGVPSRALAEGLVDGDQVPFPVSASDHARLAAMGSWDERFALLDDLLLAAARRHERHTDHPDLTHAWQRIARSHGRIRVGDLAAQLGRSARWLSGQFADEYGVSPKQAARLHRFDRSRRLAGRGLYLADVASHSGYVDQAHLTRDWKDLSALTPTQVLGDPFRIVQDDA